MNSMKVNRSENSFGSTSSTQRQNSRQQTDVNLGEDFGHSTQIDQYLDEENASEALAIGQDRAATASNKESAMREYLRKWSIAFERMGEEKFQESHNNEKKA